MPYDGGPRCVKLVNATHAGHGSRIRPVNRWRCRGLRTAVPPPPAPHVILTSYSRHHPFRQLITMVIGFGRGSDGCR